MAKGLNIGVQRYTVHEGPATHEFGKQVSKVERCRGEMVRQSPATKWFATVASAVYAGGSRCMDWHQEFPY